MENASKLVVEAFVKVLMVVESHAKQAGGGPRYWAQLSAGLIRRGHDVIILSGTPVDGEFASPNTVGLLPVQSNLRNRNLPTLVRRYLFQRRLVPLVRAYAREWSPDVIHTLPPIASKAALRAGTDVDAPVIASVLSHVEAQWTYLEPGFVRARVFRFLEARALRDPFSQIICLTRRSEQVLVAEGVPVERIVYVPHAVDITLFRSGADPRFRHRLGLSEEAFVIGYAGALTRNKGFDQLLAAMKQLNGVTDLHLLIAGSLSVQDQWQAYVRELGLERVHFLGQLDHADMPEFMASLDLYVIPSVTETLPTTLLEALATGTPVMATAVGGITEFLQKSWGILLDCPDKKCIVHALDEWRTRRPELERMGKRGQRYVRKHHNWDRTSELTEGVYRACQEE